jgi:hypothetical protein
MNEAEPLHNEFVNALLPITPRTTYQDLRRLTHTVRLGAWAQVLPSRAQSAASRERRFPRWLHHPAIDPPQWHLPVVQAALVDWPAQTRLYVALDTTALPPFVLIRASLLYRGRADSSGVASCAPPEHPGQF